MLAAGERAVQHGNRIVFSGNLTETAELLERAIGICCAH